MATNELTSVDSPSWLNKWSMPFWWIILAPIVTVPLSAILFSGLAGYLEPPEVGLPPNPPPCTFLYGFTFGDPDIVPDCGPQFRYSEVSPTIFAFVLPGLLNLAPFLWVSSTRPRVLAAGIVAGLLGIVRFSIPVIVLMTASDRVTDAGGTTYFEWINSSPHDEVWSAGVMAWLGSLLVWALFGRLTRRSASEREVFPAVALGIVGGLALLLALLLGTAADSPYAALPLIAVGAALLLVSYLGLSGGRRGASAGGADWGTDSNLPVAVLGWLTRGKENK